MQPDLAITADRDGLSAAEIAQAVAARRVSALSVTEAALARIAKHDSVLNSFTDVTAARARAKARSIDAVIAAGKNPGPLAGVPVAVKNLFDVQGLPTRAGSKINRDLKPSPRDATLVERLGYPPDAKLLIVNCDDLGSSHAANIGVYEALRSGMAR